MTFNEKPMKRNKEKKREKEGKMEWTRKLSSLQNQEAYRFLVVDSRLKRRLFLSIETLVY